jgi:hypothetical protein
MLMLGETNILPCAYFDSAQEVGPGALEFEEPTKNPSQGGIRLPNMFDLLLNQFTR